MHAHGSNGHGNSAVQLEADQALRLADDLDALRLEEYDENGRLVNAYVDGTGDIAARWVRWSEEIAAELRGSHQIVVSEEIQWWEWLFDTIGGLEQQASDWTYVEWAAELHKIPAHLMVKACRMGIRVEVARPAEIWVSRSDQAGDKAAVRR
jgi:hypothetical protein